MCHHLAQSVGLQTILLYIDSTAPCSSPVAKICIIHCAIAKYRESAEKMRHHAQKLRRIERMADKNDTQSITVAGGLR